MTTQSFSSSNTTASLASTQYFQKKIAGRYYIQVGSFSNKDNASRFKKNMRLKTELPVSVHQKNKLYAVTLGPFYSAAETKVIIYKLHHLEIPQNKNMSMAVPSGLAPAAKIELAHTPTITKKIKNNIYPWLLTASFGYTNVQNMYENDGQSALGRLAIGKEFFTAAQLNCGLEFGVESGNTMRFAASQLLLDELGGLPIQSTLKPMLDLLITLRTVPLEKTPMFGQLKGGLAYRHWQFDDRSSINDLSQLAGEVQAGLGAPISERINLAILYQGIFGGNPNFSVNVLEGMGHVDSIPIQQGVLLSLLFTV